MMGSSRRCSVLCIRYISSCIHVYAEMNNESTFLMAFFFCEQYGLVLGILKSICRNAIIPICYVTLPVCLLENEAVLLSDRNTRITIFPSKLKYSTTCYIQSILSYYSISFTFLKSTIVNTWLSQKFKNGNFAHTFSILFSVTPSKRCLNFKFEFCFVIRVINFTHSFITTQSGICL